MNNDGQILKLEIKELNLTQDEAASKLSISRQTLSVWISKALFDRGTKDKIKSALNIDIDNSSFQNIETKPSRMVVDLRSFRRDKNLSQRDICELLDISQPYCSELENNIKIIPQMLINKLRDKYGEDINNYLKVDKNTSYTNMIDTAQERISELETNCKLKEEKINSLLDKIAMLEERIKDKDALITILNSTCKEVVKDKKHS